MNSGRNGISFDVAKHVIVMSRSTGFLYSMNQVRQDVQRKDYRIEAVS